MEYIIGTILAIIVLIIIGLLLRKRLYDSVDYYESWKLDIMNRNIAAELSRVKSLNLQGYTKGKFEDWKEQWENILTVELANVEEMLYDTEHSIDRFLFSSAKKSLKQIEQVLVKLEKEIEEILTELNELLAVEKSTREEVNFVKPLLNDLRKQLSQNRYQFDRAEIRFEVEFDDLDNQLQLYNNYVEEGNYVQAKEIIDAVRLRAKELQEEIDEFPELYKQCKNELPAQLDEIFKGLKEMKDEGYRVEHLNFEKEINEYQSRLLDCVTVLEKDGTSSIKEVIDEIEERITEMFQQLEKEAIAKNYVESKLPSYKNSLENFHAQFTNTKLEVEDMKQTYFLEDSDLEKYMNLEKMITQLKEKLDGFATKLSENKHAHSKLRGELEAGFHQLEIIIEEHDLFKKRIHNLRKDETEARKQLEAMNDDIYKTHRLLRNSNLPGIPNFIWSLMDEAKEKNERVLKALDQQPLDIVEVQKSMTAAKNAVANAMENTNIMIEQAQLTEQVIQYANRYRSAYPILAANLMEAERLFRANEYELALEKAASAIEEIEPGALKRIEKYQEMTV